MPSKRPSTRVARADSVMPVAGSAGSVSLTIDAALVAPLLGLAPDAFMDALKRGAISQVAERGIDDDEGSYRVTFRYRRRRCRVIVRRDIGTAAPAEMPGSRLHSCVAARTQRRRDATPCHLDDGRKKKIS
jgi:hypothetical protein